MESGSDTHLGLKGRLETWKNALESKGLRVNVKKTKKIITDGGNSAKVTMEGRFPCAAYKNGVGINSILCQFCRCWVYKRYNSIGGKLKKDNKFKCQSCANFFFFLF